MRLVRGSCVVNTSSVLADVIESVDQHVHAMCAPRAARRRRPDLARPPARGDSSSLLPEKGSVHCSLFTVQNSEQCAHTHTQLMQLLRDQPEVSADTRLGKKVKRRPVPLTPWAKISDTTLRLALWESEHAFGARAVCSWM